MKNLKELINLAFANRLGKKSSTPYRSSQDEFEPGYNPMTGKTDLNVNALAKKVRETKFTKEYDDNPALKGGQKGLPDALQKGIINKSQNEHHLKNNPDAKYVATAAPNGWFDVWEGETFDITGENGVLVGKFKTMKDAKDYANIKNTEQGKLEAPKNYLKEDANKIIALEKERERLMADMEQEAEPEGGSTADKYGVKLDRIDKALAKLKGTKKQYKVLSTAELDKLATIKR
jgi:hypothetical protein